MSKLEVKAVCGLENIMCCDGYNKNRFKSLSDLHLLLLTDRYIMSRASNKIVATGDNRYYPAFERFCEHFKDFIPDKPILVIAYRIFIGGFIRYSTNENKFFFDPFRRHIMYRFDDIIKLTISDKNFMVSINYRKDLSDKKNNCVRVDLYEEVDSPFLKLLNTKDIYFRRNACYPHTFEDAYNAVEALYESIYAWQDVPKKDFKVPMTVLYSVFGNGEEF